MGDLGSFISDLVGGAGDWISKLVGGAGEAAGSLGGEAAGAGSDAWQGFGGGNLWGGIGAGLQTGDTLMRMLMQGRGGQQGGFDMSGMQAQMAQPAGPSQEMVRRRLADSQAQGMSGASPDFLASMAGVTPNELNQLMGYSYGGR